MLLCFACVETLGALELLRCRDVLTSSTFGILKDASHESFDLTSSTFGILKEASHESFVFTHHGCHLNVRTVRI